MSNQITNKKSLGGGRGEDHAVTIIGGGIALAASALVLLPCHAIAQGTAPQTASPPPDAVGPQMNGDTIASRRRSAPSAFTAASGDTLRERCIVDTAQLAKIELALTIHGAKGNSFTKQRRRGYSVRMAGEDVRYADRAWTSYAIGDDLVDGARLSGHADFPTPHPAGS